MADIVVTIPKSIKWADYQRELQAAEEGAILHFKVGAFPKAEIGERCYIVYNGRIWGFHNICGFAEHEFTCETTGKRWAGKFIERTGRFYNTEYPRGIGGVKGFRGFRYYAKLIDSLRLPFLVYGFGRKTSDPIALTYMFEEEYPKFDKGIYELKPISDSEAELIKAFKLFPVRNFYDFSTVEKYWKPVPYNLI